MHKTEKDAQLIRNDLTGKYIFPDLEGNPEFYSEIKLASNMFLLC